MNFTVNPRALLLRVHIIYGLVIYTRILTEYSGLLTIAFIIMMTVSEKHFSLGSSLFEFEYKYFFLLEYILNLVKLIKFALLYRCELINIVLLLKEYFQRRLLVLS